MTQADRFGAAFSITARLVGNRSAVEAQIADVARRVCARFLVLFPALRGPGPRDVDPGTAGRHAVGILRGAGAAALGDRPVRRHLVRREPAAGPSSRSAWRSAPAVPASSGSYCDGWRSSSLSAGRSASGSACGQHGSWSRCSSGSAQHDPATLVGAACRLDGGRTDGRVAAGADRRENGSERDTSRVNPSAWRRSHPKLGRTRDPRTREPATPAWYNHVFPAGVAQLVRARGSYPRRPGFKSLHRHHLRPGGDSRCSRVPLDYNLVSTFPGPPHHPEARHASAGYACARRTVGRPGLRGAAPRAADARAPRPPRRRRRRPFQSSVARRGGGCRRALLP